ncbi:signal peptidase II [Tropicimonas sp. S265A]|uniref:signal peptidase II n=1 Tax=Tropicimonas sp. S265A TaxID=3415134 RepID=UPI003C7B8408
MRVLWITAAIAFVIDQISKWLVVHVLELSRIGFIEVFPPFLTFRMGWNRGINFGLFGDGGDASRWVLVGLAVLISIAVVVWVRRERSDLKVMICTGLLVGGAMGNVLDRLIYGAVADFLNMSCCGIRNPYTFNVADISIFAGAIGLAIWSGGKKEST